MRTAKLGHKQQMMIDYVMAYGRCYISRDTDSQRVALSLAHRGLIRINRDYQCWTIRLTSAAEKIAA